MFHVHDYDMVFKGNGLDYELRCSCGDVAPNMQEAIQRTSNSMSSRRVTVIVILTLLWIGFSVLLAVH